MKQFDLLNIYVGWQQVTGICMREYITRCDFTEDLLAFEGARQTIYLLLALQCQVWTFVHHTKGLDVFTWAWHPWRVCNHSRLVH